MLDVHFAKCCMQSCVGGGPSDACLAHVDHRHTFFGSHCLAVRGVVSPNGTSAVDLLVGYQGDKVYICATAACKV